jgi:RNA recognition motif-containing protein
LASKTLYVGNIPYSFREPDVESMFKKFGTIVKVTVVLDQYTGRNKGYNDNFSVSCTIRYAEEEKTK